MTWRYANGTIVKEGDQFRRDIEDDLERTGFCTDFLTVKFVNGTKELGWYSQNEKRVIPFRECYTNNTLNDCVKI